MAARVLSFFWNHREKRWRAPWRLLLFGVLLIVLFPIIQLNLMAASESIIDALPRDIALAVSRSVDGLAATLVITAAVAIAGWMLDRRPFPDFGFHLDRSWWIDFGFGLALGGLLMGAIFVVELALGWVTVTDLWRSSAALSFPVAILVPLIAFLFVGYYEELLVRGYLLRNLAEGLGFGPITARWALLAAWLFTSALFGLLHAGNPNASFVSSFNIGLAGLFLGLGILLTGELAIPIGLHISWNFFQGNVFGFPVSGLRVSDTTVIAIHQSGPPLWTGGAFGPEAGLLGLFAIAVGCLLTLLWVRWRTGKLALHTPFATYPARNHPQKTQMGAD